MKLQNLLFTILLATILTACEDVDTSPFENQLTYADSIAGVWQVERVTFSGDPRDEWEDFELTVQNATDSTGVFITNNSAAQVNFEEALIIWPLSSAWKLEKIKGQTNHTMNRSDDVIMSIVSDLSLNKLSLSFASPIPEEPCAPSDTAGCPLSFQGSMVFSLERME